MYRSGFGMKNKLSRILRSSCYGLKPKPSTAVNDVGCPRFPSLATERSFLTHLSEKVAHGGMSMLLRQHAMLPLSPFQLSSITSQHMSRSCFTRSFASQTGSEESEIWTPGGHWIFASYAACVGIFLLSWSEYVVFNKILERVQNDVQVRERIGSPIQCPRLDVWWPMQDFESPIRSKSWIDDDDRNEHVQVEFDIHGPHGAGKVYSEMFKDKVDKEWKCKHLTVELEDTSLS